MYRLLFCFLPVLTFAQATPESTEALKVVNAFFDGMRAGDSSAVRTTLYPGAQLNTYYFTPSGETKVVEGESIDEFLKAVGTPHDKVWDERLWNPEVRIDGPLATVWAEYTFFLGSELSHCGIDLFILYKKNGKWGITLIADTRRKSGCLAAQPDDVMALNTLVDGWHHAAATADEDTFFGAMTPDGIYLGTDASERWLRDELRSWAAKAFEREVAWDFTPYDRQLYFNDEHTMAWWEESLKTWMGVCRGSGVAQKTAEGWKIKHYHLSVTVPNDKIKAFIELTKP